jgi:hypothetical protein
MQKKRERFLLEIGIMVLLNKYFIMIASSPIYYRSVTGKLYQTLLTTYKFFVNIFKI